MELRTTQATISNLPTVSDYRLLASNLIRPVTFLPLNRSPVSFCIQRSRILRCTSSFPRETVSEEKSNGVNELGGDKRDGAVAVGDVTPVEKSVYDESVSEDAVKQESAVDEPSQALEFLDNIKLDTEDTYSILLYGGGAVVALYLASAVVGAIDSIPLFPKLMEVVGLGYTFWFTTRYLLFKKNREELAVKVKEIKQQVLGSDDK